MNEPTDLQLTQLRADVVRVAGELAWRLADQSGHGTYHRTTDLADVDATRAVRLAVLTALHHLAAELDSYTAEVARAAAEVGADYSDLAAAAGLASRQLARHTWPGLAPITKAARDAQRALRDAPEYVLWFGDSGWAVWGDDKPLYDPEGFGPEQTSEAVRWAAEQIRLDGWRVAGWTDPDEDGHRTAILSGPTSLPRPQDLPTGALPQDIAGVMARSQR